MKRPLFYVTDRYIIKRTTNKGDLAKMYVSHIMSLEDNMDDTIVIIKMVLSKNEHSSLFPIVKRYKEWILTREHISLKTSTLRDIVNKTLGI